MPCFADWSFAPPHPDGLASTLRFAASRAERTFAQLVPDRRHRTGSLPPSSLGLQCSTRLRRGVRVASEVALRAASLLILPEAGAST